MVWKSSVKTVSLQVVMMKFSLFFWQFPPKNMNKLLFFLRHYGAQGRKNLTVLPALHTAVQIRSPDPLLHISEKVPRGAYFSPLPTDSFASSTTRCAAVSRSPRTLLRDEHVQLRPRNLSLIPTFPIGLPGWLLCLLARGVRHSVFMQCLASWRVMLW